MQPIEVERNVFSILSPHPVDIIHICTPPQPDIISTKSGYFNVTLSNICYRAYVETYILEYKTPTESCKTNTLPCRDPVINVFKKENIQQFLNYVDNLHKGINIQNPPLIYDTVFKHSEEILLPVAILTFVLMFTVIYVCVKLWRKRQSNALRTNDIPLTRPIFVDTNNTIYKD